MALNFPDVSNKVCALAPKADTALGAHGVTHVGYDPIVGSAFVTAAAGEFIIEGKTPPCMIEEAEVVAAIEAAKPYIRPTLADMARLKRERRAKELESNKASEETEDNEEKGDE